MGRLKTITAGAGLTVATTMAVGCVDNAPVDHETTRKAVQNNTSSVSDSVTRSLKFLEKSELFAEAWETMHPTGRVCSEPAGPSGDASGGQDSGSTECETVEPEGFDASETRRGRQMLQKVLDERVFTSGNVAASSRKSVTYRVRGRVFCQRDDYTYASSGSCTGIEEDGGRRCTDAREHFDREGYNSCVKTVDKAEIRLKVTSPKQGDLDIAVLVGPDRYHPLDFELYSDRVAVEADLAEAKASVSYLAAFADGGDPTDTWPKTVEGRVRAELRATGSNAAAAAMSILEPVRIKGGDWDISVGRSTPAWRIAVDGQKRQVTATTSLGTVDAAFPVEPFMADAVEPVEVGASSDGSSSGGSSDDTSTGDATDSPESLRYRVHLAGLSAKTTFKAGQEQVDVSGVGLGTGTSWLEIEGQRVFEVDLNKGSGRTLDATLTPAEQGDGVDLSVSPKFDLQMLFKFARIKDKSADWLEWMYDDMLRVRLDGANPAEVRLTEESLKVLKGTLTLQSKARTITASGGQCLVAEAADSQPPSTDGSDGGSGSSGDGSSGGDGSGSVETTEPFEGLSAGACGMGSN